MVAGTIIGAAVGYRPAVEFAATKHPDVPAPPVACAPPMALAVIPSSMKVYAAADATSQTLIVLRWDPVLCVDKSPDGLGFHRVRLSDGRVGFVLEPKLSSLSDVQP